MNTHVIRGKEMRTKGQVATHKASTYRILPYKRQAQINASAQISAQSVAQRKEINTRYQIKAQ